MNVLTDDEIHEIYSAINFYDHEEGDFPAVVNRIIGERVAAERERIATALAVADPIEYALAGTAAGEIAAWIARTSHQDQQ